MQLGHFAGQVFAQAVSPIHALPLNVDRRRSGTPAYAVQAYEVVQENHFWQGPDRRRSGPCATQDSRTIGGAWLGLGGPFRRPFTIVVARQLGELGL